MDTIARDIPPHLPSMGSTTRRSFCDGTEPQVTDIRVSSTGRERPGHRRILVRLESDERLRLSSHQPRGTSHTETQDSVLHSDSDSSSIPGHTWFQDLLNMLVDVPIEIPPRADLLSQPVSRVLHERPRMLHLHAWRLSNKVLLYKAF